LNYLGVISQMARIPTVKMFLPEKRLKIQYCNDIWTIDITHLIT